MSLKRCQRYAQVIVDGSVKVLYLIRLVFGNGHYNAAIKLFLTQIINVYESKYTAEITGTSYWAAIQEALQIYLIILMV